jgi:deazaflavin-dependent oxidoreductase (nitroreductase family)
MQSYRQSRPFQRLVRRSAASRPLARLYGRIQQPVDRFVYRLTGGRATLSSSLSGIEVSMLTTTGAKTGRPRTLPVLALPDGQDLILIASNFGRLRHPSWYHNLRANPHATIVTAGVSRKLVARELSGADRERWYARAEQIFPPFTQYPRWAGKREIPVLRLHASSTPPGAPFRRPGRGTARADSAGVLNRPEGVAMDSSGRVMVTEDTTHRASQ